MIYAAHPRPWESNHSGHMNPYENGLMTIPQKNGSLPKF
jgi:hypothetical protein